MKVDAEQWEEVLLPLANFLGQFVVFRKVVSKSVAAALEGFGAVSKTISPNGYDRMTLIPLGINDNLSSAFSFSRYALTLLGQKPSLPRFASFGS